MPQIQQMMNFVGVASGAQAQAQVTLNILQNRAVIPDIIAFDNPAFDYVSLVGTTLTIINNGSVAGNCDVWLYYFHSIDRSYGAAAITALVPAPFIIRGAGSGAPTQLHGEFATFDPRIDGLAAAPSSQWYATDCPMIMIKIGPGNFDWNIAGAGQQSVLISCTTTAQVNALYQGLARQPGLDFTPDHLLTPDLVNNRLSDVAGDHLTKQGAGTGASIGKGPLYDNLSNVAYEARQTTGNSSYYAAADASKYDITTGPYVIGWVQSCTLNADGGVTLGKWRPAPGQDRGFAITLNAFGGFGFLIDGSLLNLNVDTPFGTAPVDDGRLHLFHHGLSNLAGGLGFVRTSGVPPVTQAGQPGDFHNTDAIFGLHQTSGAGALTAQGNQQVQKMIVWTGQAAENVTAYLDEIEAALQAQLGTAIVAGESEPTNINPTTPARTLGAAFQPSISTAMLCLYSVKVETNGNGAGHVELRADLAVNPPTTVRGRVGRGIVAGAFVDNAESQLVFLAPPGWYVLLVAVTDAGTPTFSITAQCEESILP